jgi:hypothetical protein
MQSQELPEYPTPEQIKELYEAYKTGKPGAIAEVLRRRREAGETAARPEDATPAPPANAE